MQHIVIDGYNFLHASHGTDHDWMDLDLEAAREAIVNFLATRRRPRREKVTVVFDGSAVGGVRHGQRGGVEIIFSEPGVTADEVICRMAKDSPNPRSFLVVTADREIREYVLALGAKVIGPRTFLVSSEEHHDKRMKRPGAEPPEKYRGTTPGEVEYWRRIFGVDDDVED